MHSAFLHRLASWYCGCLVHRFLSAALSHSTSCSFISFAGSVVAVDIFSQAGLTSVTKVYTEIKMCFRSLRSWERKKKIYRKILCGFFLPYLPCRERCIKSFLSLKYLYLFGWLNSIVDLNLSSFNLQFRLSRSRLVPCCWIFKHQSWVAHAFNFEVIL